MLNGGEGEMSDPPSPSIPRAMEDAVRDEPFGPSTNSGQASSGQEVRGEVKY